MKKTLLMSIMLLVGIVAWAQQPVITFKEKEHNFGKIEEAGGRVSTVFEFKNEGMEPLVISNVRASCGCTTPTWTRTPIEPGQTGTITVTYNPNGRPGRFQKSITITSNASTPTVKLYIKGEVIPKGAKPVDKYPVKMGPLGLAKKEVNFGIIQDSQTSALQSIEYANISDHQVTVELVGGEQAGVMGVMTLLVLEPKQSGMLQVKLNGGELGEYGSISRELGIIINGKKSDAHKVVLRAIVKEDFSKLTAEQRQQAPILEIEQKIDLGTLKVGEKVSKKLNIKNAGVNPLIIRKLSCKSAAGLTIKPAKSSIKGGKASTISIAVDAKTLKPSSYTRQLEVITNDPNRSRIYVTITWKVE